ncbi:MULTISPECIES: DUF1102 domain-containing protein [Halobacterium]|uniref:DUF1102 domain-containing protein n=1 Tax=Halobacterium TaxID=2239 RepID=UPI00073E6FBB|nr:MULTISPECIES: DUF1102 domain-containing protein [Halobacterium]MCG1004314.1 DUF1102 domain-containing protein [Halobacterium noricense]
MKRYLALAAALALAGTLAFPSVAAPLFSGPTDNIGEGVELAPSSDYASLRDGELVVDLSAANPDAEGVNDDAVTGIEDVFRMRYNGSRVAHVWLTHDSEAVTFYADGAPVQSEAANVTLAPNETVAVGLRVDTTGETADGLIDQITVHARAADPEDVGSDASTPSEASGSTVQTSAPSADSRQFTALGTAFGDTVAFDASRLELDRAGNASLSLDDVSVRSGGGTLSMRVATTDTGDARSLVANAGAEPLGAVRFSVSTGRVDAATVRFSAPPAYFEARNVTPANLSVYRDGEAGRSTLDVELLGERDGRLRFAAETPGFSTLVVAADRARLAVTDAAVAPATVSPNESVAVTATISNDGSLAGERTVPVAVDGAVVAERTVSVAAGESETVTAEITRNETGEYAVSVDGTDAGAFTVAPAPSAGADADAEAASQPQSEAADADRPVEEPAGFGLADLLGLVGALAVLAAVIAVTRRTEWR